MAFDDREDYIEWLKELPETDLARLYKLVVCVDHDTRDPEKEISYQYAFQRGVMEENWSNGEPLPEGAEPDEEEEDAAPAP